MTVRYHDSKAGLVPTYVCQQDGVRRAESMCQSILGAKIDEAIGELLLEMITPATLELALDVQRQLQAQLDRADRLRKQHVERARYEAELAQQRYMKVDPHHRLVADQLEADWNAKLRALHEAQQQYEQQSQADRAKLSAGQRQEVQDLAKDFPRLWRDPRTPQRERKRMVRLLIEDVTLVKGTQLDVHVRLRGGTTRSLTMPLPTPSYKSWQTDPEVVSLIDRLLEEHNPRQVAAQLNERGLRSGKGGRFTGKVVSNICRSYHLKSHYERLREAGMLTRGEIARQLGIALATVSDWRRHGLLNAQPYDENNRYLYQPLGEQKPVKCQGRKLSDPRRLENLVSNETKEV
jgi:hypothetical protein